MQPIDDTNYGITNSCNGSVSGSIGIGNRKSSATDIVLQVPDRNVVPSGSRSRKMTSTSDEVREYVLRSNLQRQQMVAQKLLMMLHQSSFGSHTSLPSIGPGGNMEGHPKIKIRSADYGL